MKDMKLLIQELSAYPEETEYLEFKENFVEFEKEGKDICALANSATLHDVRFAYKVWGVTDKLHEVVGTSFYPRKQKHGNQDLEIWLRSMLSSNVHFEFEEGEVFGKHVVVAKIMPAAYQIARFKNEAYIRTGSSTQKLVPGSRRESELWAKVGRAAFETQVALEHLMLDEVVSLLDVPLYYEKLGEPMPAQSESALHALEVDRFVVKDVDGSYAITNLGALTIARDVSAFPSVARKALRVIRYDGSSRILMQKEETLSSGYAQSFEDAFRYLMALLPSEERIEGAVRRTEGEYPQIALRELMGNSLIHQDFQIGGAGPMVEVFDGRIEFTNPGQPLVDVSRIVNDPPCSRNEHLAGIMRRMGICEEAGTGWDKIIYSCELLHLPAPRIELYGDSTRVVLYGRRSFKDLAIEEKRDACYWHVCVRYAARDYASNQSLRERFGLKDSNSAQISRLLKTCVEQGLIKPVDPSTSPRYMRYIPQWA